MKVVAISGKAQHGKDTTANFLKSELEANGCKVLITHYADLLKYICTAFFNWDGQKDEHGRQLLQYVGTDVVRAKRPDFWVEFVTGVLNLFDGQWDYVLIPDCRFPNEVTHLTYAGFDTFHVRVIRENFESPLTPEQQMHPSETALDDFPYSFMVLNYSSLADLEYFSKLLAQEIMKAGV